MPVVGPMEGTLVPQVLKVALLFSFLGKEKLFPSRKGAWNRVRKGLVPYEGFLEQPQPEVLT